MYNTCSMFITNVIYIYIYNKCYMVYNNCYMVYGCVVCVAFCVTRVAMVLWLSLK